MTSENTDRASEAARQKAERENEIARALKARFVHAGAHSGARELCRILIRYRLRQLEGGSA